VLQVHISVEAINSMRTFWMVKFYALRNKIQAP